MRCMMCFQEKEMNQIYKSIFLCSEGCKNEVEALGIERLIMNKEAHLKRYKTYATGLKVEKGRKGITFEGITYDTRTKEDIENTKADILILEGQIEELKQHSDVRLKYLFQR